MKKFYIIQLLDGRYVHEYIDYFSYSKNMEIAARFDSKKQAKRAAPEFSPFIIIEVYDKELD